MVTTATATSAAGLVIQGTVHGGQQPVSGARVYLLQANTTGYGQPSVSLLVPTSTGHGDSIGGYVLTAGDGSFNIYGDYTCNANTQVYIYAQGGNPGAGANSAAGFLASLGECPQGGSFATVVPFIAVNEVSTVATAFSFAGFAIDALHVSSSGSALAQTGIANAFLSTANLENVATGYAYTMTPVGNGTVPTATINTLADILAACINSTGPTSPSCTTLFGAAKSGGSTGTVATETATAAINIAHNPGTNVATLYGLVPPASPFLPTLSSTPNDFTLGINYSGNGVTGAGVNGAFSVAIDAHGDAWFTNINNSAVSKLSPTGAPQSPAGGFTGGTQGVPTGVAIDGQEDAWVSDSGTDNLTEYNTVGSPISPAGGYSGGGLSVAQRSSPQSVAIYDSSLIYTANIGNSTVSAFNFSGVPQSPSTGYTSSGQLNKPVGIAVDASHSVWVTNQGTNGAFVVRMTSTGAALFPVPVSGGGINNPFGVAIDANGIAWVASYGSGAVTKIDPSGNILTGANGITGGGLSFPYTIAMDGAGNAWIPNGGGGGGTGTVTEIANNGTLITPSTGYSGGKLNKPEGLAVDGSGNVWIANTNGQTTGGITQLIGVAVPVVCPTSTAVANGTLASRP